MKRTLLLVTAIGVTVILNAPVFAQAPATKAPVQLHIQPKPVTQQVQTAKPVSTVTAASTKPNTVHVHIQPVVASKTATTTVTKPVQAVNTSKSSMDNKHIHIQPVSAVNEKGNSGH